jgi:hypothetical protein
MCLSGLAVLSATPAAASPTSPPAPACLATTCTVTFDYTGILQSFTVPDAVTELDVVVSGASGGGTLYPLTSPGGEGGSTAATVSTVAGTSFAVLVGEAGRVGGSRAVGGGGATTSTYTGSGGGGSFIFHSDGTPAVVSGGGGGGGGIDAVSIPGGAGSGAGAIAGDGSTVDFYEPSTPARAGGASEGGAGGTNRIQADGQAGAGPSADFLPGAGGDGGNYTLWPYYDGAGGGGGYYGGGGGGQGDSGAGGSGYAAPGVSVRSATVGGHRGNGVVTISWQRAAQAVVFANTASSARVGQSYQVSATGGASGNTVTFASATPAVCIVDGSTVNLRTAGTCTVRADQPGSTSYAPGTAEQSVTVLPGDSMIAITSVAPDASVGGPTYDVAVSSGPSTGAVTLSTTDAGVCSISGSTVSFAAVGQCTVTATQAADSNYEAGTTSQSFAVTKGSQSIVFTSAVLNGAHPGDVFEVAANGGASGQTVTFGSATPAVCSVSGATVTLVTAGTCTVTADQAGDDRFDAAPTVRQDTVVTKVASVVVVTLPKSIPVTGQRVTVHAEVTADGDPATGSVQFTVDGDDLGVPSDLAIGKATSATFDVPAGQHVIGAVYLPADGVRVAGSSTSSILTVEQAATAMELTTDGHTLRAEVTAKAPGGGTPSGAVTFRVDGEPVGTAALTAGVAELVHPLENGSDHGLSGEYAGSVDFLASSVSTSRNDPIITTSLSSASAPSAAGWYRDPVTITYTCLTRGADLVAPCPEPITLSEDGAAQAVSATVNAVDGGVATVSSVVNVDRTAPTVAIRGVRDGASYLAKRPRPRCQSADALSGVLACTIGVRRVSRHVTRVTATAVDRAGNVTTDAISYRVSRRKLVGATWHDGAWEVRRGRTYTLAAVAGMRPRFVDATRGARRPQHLGAHFHRSGSVAGAKRWTHRMTISLPVNRTRVWTIGVIDGHGLHRLRLRIIR